MIDKFKTLKEEYKELLASKIDVKIEDLSDTEAKLIEESFILFESKMDEIKILNDDLRRISIDLANFKSMYLYENNEEE